MSKSNTQSKQAKLPQKTKSHTGIYIVSCTLAATLAMGGVSAYQYLTQLQQKITTAEQQLTITKSEATSLQAKLKSQLIQKEQALENITQRVDNIETLLGTKDKMATEKDLNKRLQVASVNTVTRKTLLTMVPSGKPLNYKRISSPFSYRLNPVTGRYAQHKGIDLTCNPGEKIHATAEGVIKQARYNSHGYGNLVEISHGLGFETFFAHMQKFVVKKGQFVNQGDLIGYCGSTGRSTGNHLHYEVRFLSKVLNPKPFINWSLSNFNHLFTQEKQVNWDELASSINNLVAKPVQMLTQNKIKASSHQVSFGAKATARSHLPEQLKHQKSSAISIASDTFVTP